MKKKIAFLVITVLFVGGATFTANAQRYAEVVPLQYYVTHPFSEGLAMVGVEDREDRNFRERCGFIDTTGEVVVPLEYPNAGDFHEGLAAVQVGNFHTGKWGFVDKTGKLAIPAVYDRVSRFSEGLAVVIQDGKYGFIDKNGNVKIPLVYLDAYVFSEGLAAVHNGDMWGFIDKNGNEIIPPQYEYVFLDGFHNGMAMISHEYEYEGTYGFIDKTGTEVIPCKYEFAYYYFQDGRERMFYFSDGLIALKEGEYFGYRDTSGKEVLPPIYEVAEPFVDGLAPVKKDGLWYIIDKSGNVTAELGVWGSVQPFSNGRAAVCTDGSDYKYWGFINTQGNVVIPTLYGTFGGHGPVPPKFVGDFVVVSFEGKLGILDRNGTVVLPFEYDSNGDVEEISEGMVSVGKNDPEEKYFTLMRGFVRLNDWENPQTGVEDIAAVFMAMAFGLMVVSFVLGRKRNGGCD